MQSVLGDKRDRSDVLRHAFARNRLQKAQRPLGQKFAPALVVIRLLANQAHHDIGDRIIVDDKSKYTDWSTREDIKANLQVDLILLLDEYGYPPVTMDDVYKEVLEQAENFKKYA